jgi:hypothetical protein
VLVFIAPLTGCYKPPPPAEEGTGGTATSTAPDDEEHFEGKDAEDHPDAPRALPRSSEVQGWIKMQAVEVAGGEEMTQFVEDPAVRRVLAPFKFARLARATYRCPNAAAEVLLAEGVAPEDALGAFSLANGGAPCATRVDGSLQASLPGDGKAVLIAWQGNAFLRLEYTLEQEAGLRDCERLASRTVFGLPMTEPPLLMRAVKEVPQEHCQCWFVRSAAVLRQQDNPRLRQIDPAALDSRLGLGGDAVLSVVAVEPTRGAAPIIIWLAEYATADEAKGAADRYTRAISSAPQGLDAVTHVGEPRGRFVIGTWTADQEAARNMVNMLREVLPEPAATSKAS